MHSSVSASEDDGAPNAPEPTEGKFALSNAWGAARPGEEGGMHGAAVVTSVDVRCKITHPAATAADDIGGTGVMEDQSFAEGGGPGRASPRGEVLGQPSEEASGAALLEGWLQR